MLRCEKSFFGGAMKKMDEETTNGLVIGLVFGWVIGLVASLGGMIFNCLLGAAGAALLGALASTTLGLRFPFSMGVGLAMTFGGWVFLCNDLVARASLIVGRVPPFEGEWLRNLVAALSAVAAILITITIVYFVKLAIVKIYLRISAIFA
jgi:hypothetical protein